ncbi:MAG TPA: MarR family winged helix-turn-helix transcriptional regulator [Acidimicrobiales bacterium]
MAATGTPTRTPGGAVDLMLLLDHVTHALNTELAAGLAELGISPRAYCVLAKALPGDRTQGQLAEVCALDKTTMVVAIDQLEAAGLAERRPSPTDRRARIIAVTPEGERMVRAAQRIVDGVFEDVLASLPEGERAGFVDGLARLVGGRLATPAECARPPRRRR